MNVLLVGAAILTTYSCSNIEQVLDGIRMVESSNRENPKDGDNGRAIGPYQIHKEYWIDGTRLLNVQWPYSDARNEQKSRAVVKAYITHYGGKHGIDGMIRVHNGGPNGWKKKSTLGYLRKVKAAMERGTQNGRGRTNSK